MCVQKWQTCLILSCPLLDILCFKSLYILLCHRLISHSHKVLSAILSLLFCFCSEKTLKLMNSVCLLLFYCGHTLTYPSSLLFNLSFLPCFFLFSSSSLHQASVDFRAWIQLAARWWGGPDLCSIWRVSWGRRYMAGWKRTQSDRQYHLVSCGQRGRAVHSDQCAISCAGAQQHLQLPTNQPTAWRGRLCLRHNHRWEDL